MKKNILLLALFLIPFIFINANLVRTDANIFGHVVNAKTGKHVSYINIILKNTTIGVAIVYTGHYNLKNLPEGKFVIVA